MTIDANLAQVEQELNAFLDKRAAGVAEARAGQEAANAEEERLKAEDARKLREMHAQNRVAWVQHLRRVAAAHLRIARSARARARRLEEKHD